MVQIRARAVLFDLGNTLLEYPLARDWTGFRRRRLEELWPVVCEMAGEVGMSGGEFAERVGEVIGGEKAREIERSGRSWHLGERLRQGLAGVGGAADDALIGRLMDAFYEPIAESMRPCPETRETLERLRAMGVRLGIVTNAPWDSPGRLVRRDLERWGLMGFFDGFVCSGDVEWRKPNPRFMMAAAEAVGVEAGECLVVGDSLESDVAGAKAAGMRSVWVNREGADLPQGGGRPDWVVAELGEVVGIVGGRRG